MKRLLVLVAALALWCVPARAGIAAVTTCTSAAATSCTLLATPHYGNLMVSMAYSSNSATAPTTAAGWTVVQSTTGNTNSIKIAYKYSVGNETTCGTWTNATQTFCKVYSGAWMNATGGLGSTTSGTTGTTSSTTISYPGFTLNNTFSTSWVACAVGAGSSTAGADVAPTGMTLASGTNVITIAYSDTNGVVSTWSTQTVSFTTASHWADACFEIIGSPSMGTFGNYLVQQHYTGYSAEGCSANCVLDIPLPHASLSNNLLQVAVWWVYTASAPTISNVYCNADTGHATWTFTDFGHDVADTTNLAAGAIYYSPGSAAGCTTIHVKWNATPLAFLSGHAVELRQVATSSPVNVANSTVASTSPFGTPGALATTTNGDVILYECAPSANNIGNYTSTGVFGPDPGFLLNGDDQHTIGSGGFVQTTSGSVSPYINFQGYALGSGFAADCMGIAYLASAGTGTAPSGIYVVQQVSSRTVGTSTGNFPFQMLNSSDALEIHGLVSQSAAQWTGISDSLGNSFTTHGTADFPYFSLDCNATSGADQIALTGLPAGNGGFVILEIAGLDHSSHTACYDSTAGYQTASGAASPYNTAPSITPSVAGELVLGYINFGTGPATAASSPSGVQYGYPNFTGMDDFSGMTEGGGFAYVPSAAASAQSFTWTNANSSAWNAAAIALKAAAATATTPPVWVIQP